MRKSGFIAAVALLVAAVGVVIALAAYFKNRSSYLYDEDDDYLFDDPDDLEYYTSDFEDDDQEFTSAPQPAASPEENPVEENPVEENPVDYPTYPTEEE